MTKPSYGYDVDRDDRYQFQFYDVELLRALGRLTVNASYLEGVIRTMYARLLDNRDLGLGERVTADAGFRWLTDHTRALSEHRLEPVLHQQLVDWLRDSEAAYARRNRIVHSEHITDFTGDGVVQLHWTRATAKKARFTTERSPATAQSVHEVAQTLEGLGIRGVHLMDPVMRTLSREGPTQQSDEVPDA